MSNHQLYKLTYLHTISEGDIGFEKQFLDIFLHEAPHHLKALNDGIKTSDPEKIFHHSHRLKAAILHFQIDHLQPIINEVEEISKHTRPNISLITDHNKIIQDTFTKVISDLTDYRNQLNKDHS